MDSLRSEGTLDSEGHFTLDAKYAKRKLAEDHQKKLALEHTRFEEIRKDCASKLLDSDVGIWRKYHNQIAHRMAWRWGLFASIVTFGIWWLWSLKGEIGNVTLFGHEISRLYLDPLCFGITTSIFILNVYVTYINDRTKNEGFLFPMVMILAPFTFFGLMIATFGSNMLYLPLFQLPIFVIVKIVNAVNDRHYITNALGNVFVRLWHWLTVEKF